MKKIDWINVGLFLFFSGAIVYCIIGLCNLENEPIKQNTLEYTGFDGKKHQAIVIKTDLHNWVLVETR